jgi:hypothetical protein
MSKNQTSKLQLRSPKMSRPCSKCNKALLSCEKNTLGFSQPIGEHLTSQALWQRRDYLVRELFLTLNLLTITASRTVGTEMKEHLKMCALIKKLRDIDPEWCLITAPSSDDCLRIMHYDCNCNFNYPCDCRSRKDLYQNEKSSNN